MKSVTQQKMVQIISLLSCHDDLDIVTNWSCWLFPTWNTYFLLAKDQDVCAFPTWVVEKNRRKLVTAQIVNSFDAICTLKCNRIFKAVQLFNYTDSLVYFKGRMSNVIFSFTLIRVDKRLRDWLWKCSHIKKCKNAIPLFNCKMNSLVWQQEIVRHQRSFFAFVSSSWVPCIQWLHFSPPQIGWFCFVFRKRLCRWCNSVPKDLGWLKMF